MQTILYARLLTTDQTIAHQRTQAAAAGFKVDKVGHLQIPVIGAFSGDG